MEFIINQTMLEKATSSKALFYQEREAFSGVNKIAKKVMHDLELVFGHAPVVTTEKDKLNSHVILYGTVGHSPILDELDKKNLIDLKEIEGKRDEFLVSVIDYINKVTE